APFSARLVTSFLLKVPSRACGIRKRPHLAADRCDAHRGVKGKRLPPVDMQRAVEHEAKHAWNGHPLGFAERAHAQFQRSELGVRASPARTAVPGGSRLGAGRQVASPQAEASRSPIKFW